jgi:hypothetical protein
MGRSWLGNDANNALSWRSGDLVDLTRAAALALRAVRRLPHSPSHIRSIGEFDEFDENNDGECELETEVFHRRVPRVWV